jgi:hypothetical protein
MSVSSALPKQVICDCFPEGFWYKDERGSGTWIGPFATFDKAEETALVLISDHQKVLVVVDLRVRTKTEKSLG